MGKFLANGIDLILDDHIKLMENFFFSHTIVLNSRHNIILSRRSISLIYSKKAISEASEYLYKSIYHSNSLSKYVFSYLSELKYLWIWQTILCIYIFFLKEILNGTRKIHWRRIANIFFPFQKCPRLSSTILSTSPSLEEWVWGLP